VTFVDYYKTDYPVVFPATVPEDYQFYFVFLRENLFDGNSVDVRKTREGWEGMREKGKRNNKERGEGIERGKEERREEEGSEGEEEGGEGKEERPGEGGEGEEERGRSGGRRREGGKEVREEGEREKREKDRNLSCPLYCKLLLFHRPYTLGL